jgi:TolA-binding protein
MERLRNQVNYLTGQLNERDNSRSQLQVTLNERIILITNLQQQLAERNASISQLQTLLSRCDNQEDSRRIGELVQALTTEIQRGQHCLQIINQLNSEISPLRIYKDLLVVLHDKYPKILPSFAFSLQQPDNSSSLPEVQNWAREQSLKLSSNNVQSLDPFTNTTSSQQSIPLNPPVYTSSSYIQPAIYSDPDYINYINLKRALGVRTKQIRNAVTPEQNEYNRLYRNLYSRFRFVPDF